MRSLLGVLFVVAVVSTPTVRGEDFKLETGFKLLFNGKDLTGWKEATYGKQAERTALDGKTESATKRFIVDKGIITIDEKAKGDLVIFTADEIAKDATIRFDFLAASDKCNNDLLWRGMKFDIKPAEVTGAKVGEWNALEIVVTGKKAEFKCNGQAVKTLDVKTDSSAFGIRAEAGPIQIKNFRVKTGS